MSIVVVVVAAVGCGGDGCVGDDCGGGGVAAAALLLQHAGLSALGRYRGQAPHPAPIPANSITGNAVLSIGHAIGNFKMAIYKWLYIKTPT